MGDDGGGDGGLGVDSGTRKGDGDGRGWVGSDMSVRHSDARLRICTFNSQKKLGISVGEIPYIEMVVDEFVEYKYDVMVIQEPGQIAAILPTASCLMAQEGGKAYGFESDSREGGCLVLVSRPWATLDPKQVRTDAKGRVCALEFVGAERRGEEPLQRLLVVGVHGVNSPHVAKAAAKTIEGNIARVVERFRGSHPSGMVIVAGDLNAAVSRHLDTDRKEGPRRELDAGFIDALRSLELHDVFREEHPELRAVTHIGTGKHAGNAKRRIDCIMATTEVSSHMSTQVGIHQGSKLGPGGDQSDHYPVVMDCAVDCAEAAGVHIPMWEQTEDVRYTVREAVLKEEKELYWSGFRGRATAALPGGDPEAEAEALLDAFLMSAEGTIMDKKVIKRPSFGRRKKGVSKEWRKVRTWARRLRRAVESLHRGDATWADVNLLTWRFQMPAPEQFTDTLVGVTELFEAGRLDELYARLLILRSRQGCVSMRRCQVGRQGTPQQ